MPVTGRDIVIGYQVCLQNRKRRNAFISEMSSANGVLASSRAIAGRSFEQSFTKQKSSALRCCADE